MFDRPPEVKKTPDDNSFEAQYARKKAYMIQGAQVEAVDIKPEKQKDAPPILVIPGWGATMESFKPGIQILAEQGRRTISLDQPRKGGAVPLMHNKNVEEWYQQRGQEYPKLPDEELRKAGNILGLLEQKGLEKVDVIAHSEGAINTCIAAMMQPEKFKSIVLYGPAGLIGKDSLLRLQKGAGANKSRTETMSEIKDEAGNTKMPALSETEAEKEYLKSTTHITPDYLKANLVRAVMELFAISQAQIEDMLRYLHEKGIKIVIMSAADDTFFPAERMQKNVHSKNTPDGFVDGFVSVRGGHMQIQTHPELYMASAESLLTALDKKE